MTHSFMIIRPVTRDKQFEIHPRAPSRPGGAWGGAISAPGRNGVRILMQGAPYRTAFAHIPFPSSLRVD